jgi:hypothetical protein
VTLEGTIDFLLEEDENFVRPGVPTMKEEHVRVREASLNFICCGGNRIADCVEKNHRDINVRRQ